MPHPTTGASGAKWKLKQVPDHPILNPPPIQKPIAGKLLELLTSVVLGLDFEPVLQVSGLGF